MDVFAALNMQRVDAATLDDVLEADDAVRVLFLWGNDCPNCDVAKARLLQAPDRFKWPDVTWLHQNVYDEPALATRFGLHGIPAFIVLSRPAPDRPHQPVAGQRCIRRRHRARSRRLGGAHRRRRAVQAHGLRQQLPADRAGRDGRWS